jgi:hypothetical protein
MRSRPSSTGETPGRCRCGTLAGHYSPSRPPAAASVSSLLPAGSLPSYQNRSQITNSPSRPSNAPAPALPASLRRLTGPLIHELPEQEHVHPHHRYFTSSQPDTVEEPEGAVRWCCLCVPA